jgi:hypothetical protein
MRVLLVEPGYRRGPGRKNVHDSSAEASETDAGKRQRSDEQLWYPPLGLMKLSSFHKQRGDEVHFVSGPDKSLLQLELMPPNGSLSAGAWDRVYVTTLFTYDWDVTIRTIELCKRLVGGSAARVFVGGIMASLMAEDVWKETGVYPVAGVLHSPAQIGLEGDADIDLLPPDYDLLDSSLYAINETYYAYTSRGCTNRCAFCGVPRIEPEFVPYIDIKPMIRTMRERYGDKPKLKLMDNNILASPSLARIVDDLIKLGYGRGGAAPTGTNRPRAVDFNQGIEAALVSDDSMRLVSKLNISPMRIAFDALSEKPEYVRAVKLAHDYGVNEFSNYMLYNWKDTPRDLYDRLVVNIELNEQWRNEPSRNGRTPAIYSYPMRYAPIDEAEGPRANRQRDFVATSEASQTDFLQGARWTRLFVRNAEIMKGVAHGAISPTPGLARRTIGESYEEFVANLYMPEELLRNRNRYERRVYECEPSRQPGTGAIEEFRTFILQLISKGGPRFREFHEVVSQNSIKAVREHLRHSPDEEIKKWLRFYVKKSEPRDQ